MKRAALAGGAWLFAWSSIAWAIPAHQAPIDDLPAGAIPHPSTGAQTYFVGASVDPDAAPARAWGRATIHAPEDYDLGRLIGTS